jgi:hypothetical protein
VTFAHALAIALMRQSELVIMHARRGEREDWSRFPQFGRLSCGGGCSRGEPSVRGFRKARGAHHEDELAFGS